MNIIHRLANLNWIAALSPLVVILMEVFWVYPWLILVGRLPAFTDQRTPLSLASVIFLLSTSFFATRFLLNRRWSLRWIQLSVVSCGLVAIFVVVRAEYGAGFELFSGQWFGHTAQVFLDSFPNPHPMMLALPVGVYLWWRGISWGRSPLYSADVYSSFLTGIVALVVLIIVWRISLGAASLESLASTVGPYVAGFFFFGLAALALYNLHAVQQKMLAEETARVFNRRWLPILLGIVGGIVLAGIGIATVFSPEFLALLIGLLNSALDLLRQVVSYLLIPLGYLAAGLVYVGQFLVNWIRGGQPLEAFKTPEFFETEELQEATVTEGLTFPDLAVLGIKWFLFAIAVMAVIFLLARAISRYRASRAKADIDEFHESLWSWQGFMEDLRLFFSMIWRRFRRKRKEAMQASPVPSWYTGDDFQGILGIRDIYKHLLWEASCLGIARRDHETPYEYTSRLGQAVPDGSEQLGELTNLYIDVRYGEIEAEDRQVYYANSLWKVLKRLLGRPETNQRAA